MAMLPFAFSIHNFISSIGADAGFAAIIGLAVLILLYFAHARETANLREEASLLTQRLQQAELRVVQLSRAQAAPAAPSGPAPAPPLQPALAPFAPAGTGAPALAAATRVVPVAPPPDFSEPVESEAEPAAAPVAALAMAGVAAGAVASPAPAAGAAPPPAPPAPTDPPAPVSSSAGPAVPAPATNAGGNGSGHQPIAAPARPTEPGWSGLISASRGGGTSAGRKPPAIGQLPPLERRRQLSWLGRGVAIAVVALAAVAIAVVLFALTSVGSSKHTPSATTSNAPGPAHSGATAFRPSSATVAVLNGTSTNQLAHRIGQKLAAAGYKDGTLATAASQTHATTVVAYTGTTRQARVANRTAALHVAQALGLRRSAVQAVDQNTLQVACPASTSCTANVVVTVGSDLANQ